MNEGFHKKNKVIYLSFKISLRRSSYDYSLNGKSYKKVDLQNQNKIFLLVVTVKISYFSLRKVGRVEIRLGRVRRYANCRVKTVGIRCC